MYVHKYNNLVWRDAHMTRELTREQPFGGEHHHVSQRHLEGRGLGRVAEGQLDATKGQCPLPTILCLLGLCHGVDGSVGAPSPLVTVERVRERFILIRLAQDECPRSLFSMPTYAFAHKYMPITCIYTCRCTHLTSSWNHEIYHRIIPMVTLYIRDI